MTTAFATVSYPIAILLSPTERYYFLRHQNNGNSRDWDFAKEDTQYSTHGLHTYLAAMNPPLARRLIVDYVPRGGIVFDPFNGGGAVLVESVLNHREVLGRDVNPLAVLIASAKTTYADKHRILAVGNAIAEEATAFEGEPLEFEKADYIHYWFKTESMAPLTGLRHSIERNTDEQTRNLFQVIFSGTVRDVSLTYRNEIRLRRMSVAEREKFNPDIVERFRARVRDAAQRVGGLPTNAKADVALGNVMRTPFRDAEFDAIVCSPPYGDERNGVPYVQFSKNMLLWLGYTTAEIRAHKQETLGWNKSERSMPPSPELARVLDIIHENPTAVREAIAFYSDYFIALAEMARVVRERIVIVIGQRVLHNTIFDNALITTELLGSLGVELETLHTRRLPTKRLPRLRTHGGGIDQELILVFHK